MIDGNGTVGLEIAEDLTEVAAVLVPFGGGGLASGVATVLRALRPEARVFGCEPETAHPLADSWQAGGPVSIRRTPSFVDGAGVSSVLPEMWDRLRGVLAGSFVVSPADAAHSVRLLAEQARVVAEGAAGLSLAAARAGRAGPGPTVCVISGGNLDSRALTEILEGRVPGASHSRKAQALAARRVGERRLNR